jgi:3-phenylpropionate/trans-cinnamate dioxygenase ferredoxin component
VSGWTSVGAAEGRPQLSAVTVEGREIALARLDDGTWTAFDNDCTHEECPLADGDLDEDRIVCYCHGSEFDVRTGEVLLGPADEPIAVYPVRVVDGRIELQLA